MDKPLDGDASARPLLCGTRSAAAVTLTQRFAYVSEKNGSLEAFLVANDGSLGGGGARVLRSTGLIKGITGLDRTVVAPIAHLASNASQSEVSIAQGLAQIERVPT